MKYINSIFLLLIAPIFFIWHVTMSIRGLFFFKKLSVKLAANVDGLLLCWYFMMSRPEPQPIEKLMMKLTTKS